MSKNRLLLVDDDLAFLQVLAKAMGKRGFEVFTSTGISDAVAQAHEMSPDMAVVDLKLRRRVGSGSYPALD